MFPTDSYRHDYASRLPRQILLILLSALFVLLAPTHLPAIELGWGQTDKDIIFGELQDFDFEKKRLTIKEADTGRKKTIPSSQLDFRSRWFLIASPPFRNSIPDDSSGSEHAILIFYLIIVPLALYLFTFWICAMAIFGKFNPVKALIALPGAWMLSAFLIAFYLFMIGRQPESTLTLGILGSLVTITCASLFIAIIYRKKMLHGLALIIIHSIAAPFIIASALYIPYKAGPTEKVEGFYNDYLFIPVGALPKKE